MSSISRTELLELAEPGTGPRVSIYLPLGRTWPEVQQNPTRLRDALDEAEQKLVERGMNSCDAKPFLEPARNLTENGRHRSLHSSAGLALLLGNGAAHSYPLPFPVPATVDVSDGFYLAPLMRLLVWPVDFQILTVSGNHVRLHRCSRNELAPMKLPSAVPTSLEEFLRETEIARAVRFQTGAGPNRSAIGIVHGGTSTKDEAHAQFREYVQTVAKEVASLRSEDEAPLVLAAVHEVQAIFRQAYPGRNLVEQGVHGSPDEIGIEELRRLGINLLEATHCGELKTALEKYHRAAETAEACDPKAIVRRAASGRIDTLIAAFGERLWGTWDASAQCAEVVPDRLDDPGCRDLVNLALVETLRHDGHVCVVPKSDVPDQSTMAAVYRW